MSQPMLPAVDELADLRRTLAGLRQRELELCDEIRANATEIGATRIDGTTGMAMIETRQPMRLDMSKLPSEILNNPDMFSAVPQTHVLLWPKAGAAIRNTAQETSFKDTALPESMDELQQMNTTDIDSSGEDQLMVATAHASVKSDALTLSDTKMTDLNLSMDMNADTSEPVHDVSFDDRDSTEESEESIEPSDGLIPDMAESNGAQEPPMSVDTDLCLNISSATLIHEKFETGNEIKGTETAEITLPIFDTASTDARLPSLNMPPLDAHDIANAAEEVAPPADLLATRHTDLQPLGDLTEEDLDAAIYAAEQDLPPVVDPDAVLGTEVLQAEFDTRVENLDTINTDEPAPFVTRRIIGMPS